MRDMSPRLENQAYYDEFASWYERDRHFGYHALIDDLEIDLVLPYCQDRDVLEIGCGTGLILRRIAERASSAKGVDISPGMLEKARERGLDVVEGSATELPYDDDSFDTVYSFKVLAHVEDMSTALFEGARVTRSGGHLLLEFYNRHSLRYLAKRLSRPGAVSDKVNESAVYTRWDSLDELTAILPPELELIDVAGVRVVTPAAFIMKVPLLRSVIRKAEFTLRDSAAARLGGFLVLVLRKR